MCPLRIKRLCMCATQSRRRRTASWDFELLPPLEMVSKSVLVDVIVCVRVFSLWVSGRLIAIDSCNHPAQCRPTAVESHTLRLARLFVNEEGGAPMMRSSLVIEDMYSQLVSFYPVVALRDPLELAARACFLTRYLLRLLQYSLYILRRGLNS